MKLEFLRPNQKLANIKFNETPSRGSTVLPCGLTDEGRQTRQRQLSSLQASLFQDTFPQTRTSLILVYHTALVNGGLEGI